MAYIPSLRVLKEGGYEGAAAMLYYGLPSPWAGRSRTNRRGLNRLLAGSVATTGRVIRRVGDRRAGFEAGLGFASPPSTAATKYAANAATNAQNGRRLDGQPRGFGARASSGDETDDRPAQASNPGHVVPPGPARPAPRVRTYSAAQRRRRGEEAADAVKTSRPRRGPSRPGARPRSGAEDVHPSARPRRRSRGAGPKTNEA